MIPLLATALLSTASAADFSEEWRDALSQRRQAHIERLTEYAAAGRFPLNLTQPGPAHMFMDDTGSRCAMAELIWMSGHEELVVETYQSANDLVIADLDGGALTDWVAVSGLTMAEVAFIQEPGFMVGDLDFIDEPVMIAEPDLVELERSRRTAHFTMAAKQLTLTTEASLDAAVLALGDRVNQPPTERVWTSWIPHATALTKKARRIKADSPRG